MKRVLALRDSLERFRRFIRTRVLFKEAQQFPSIAIFSDTSVASKNCRRNRGRGNEDNSGAEDRFIISKDSCIRESFLVDFYPYADPCFGDFFPLLTVPDTFQREIVKTKRRDGRYSSVEKIP